MPAMLARRGDREQVPLLALAAGVADHAGGAADHGDGTVPGLLEPAQDHQRHQVSDVQAIGRGIKARVDRPRLLRSSRGDSRRRSSGGSVRARRARRRCRS